MARVYYRKIRSGDINPGTGNPWVLDDVPDRWNAAVQALLEADGSGGV